MTNGTSQGLFIVVAIVIFGIFVGISYTVFGDTLNPTVANLFTEATENATKDLNKGTIKVVDIYEDSIFTYTFEGNTATITGFESGKNKTSIVIPHVVNKEGVSYPVTAVGPSAFKGTVNEVVIPNSIIYIGNGAFRNNALVDVVIPDSVKQIATQAFYASTIKTLDLGNSVEYLGWMAFAGTEIEELHIPESMISLGTQSFDFTPLKTIYIPKSEAVTPESVRSDSSVPETTEIVVR